MRLNKLLAVTLLVAGCAGGSGNYFDPTYVQQVEKSAARDHPPYPELATLPTTREEPVRIEETATSQPDWDNERVVRMTLEEIIHRSVLNNHDVKVAGYQPGIDGSRAIEHEANFDPVFFTNFQYQQKHDLNGGNIFNSFSGGPLIVTNVADSDTGSVQTGIQQNLDSGGQIQLQYQSQYSWMNPQQTEQNPFYENDLTLSLTQPLLRNFGYGVNHAQITIDKLNQKVSLLDFRKALEQNAADIEKAYWQLAQAVRDVEIQRDLLLQTQHEYDVLSNRMKQNLDVSELQVSQTQTELESRRGQLINFQYQVRNLSDQIKALMSDPELPITSNILILPADAPVETPMHFVLEDEISTAMDNRLELGEQQLKVDEAIVTIGVAKNNLLPQLDFIGSVGPEGAAGNLGDAAQSSMSFNHVDFSVGFKLQVPLGNRSARAIYRRTVLQRLQAIEAYKSEIEKVALDVKTGARGVENAWRLIDANRRSRFAAEDALQSIVQREQANEPLTPEFVQLKLDTQDRYAQARQNEAEAVANYNVALSQLELAKGTLLKYNHVILAADLDKELSGDDDGSLR